MRRKHEPYCALYTALVPQRHMFVARAKDPRKYRPAPPERRDPAILTTIRLTASQNVPRSRFTQTSGHRVLYHILMTGSIPRIRQMLDQTLARVLIQEAMLAVSDRIRNVPPNLMTTVVGLEEVDSKLLF